MELRYLAEAMLYLAIICIAIGFLRKRHSGEIFLIWYLFSFFFILVTGLGISGNYPTQTTSVICGSYKETCAEIFTLFINVDDELFFVGTLAALAIIPQILTYILSGLSGSARSPTGLWHIEKFAIWSFIKVSACYSGAIVSFFIWGPQFVSRQQQISAGLQQIAIPFGLAAVELWLTDALPRIWIRCENSLSLLKKVHDFCTKNTRGPALNHSDQTQQNSSLPKI
jgi:hypothetical protein